jgi:hypothetical protein
MSVEQTKFAIGPKWVSDSDLSDRAIRLYVILVNHANNDTRHGHPGRRKLATICRCSESSLDRAMKELVEFGAVVVRPRFDDNGNRTTNDYWVPIDPPLTVGGVSGDARGGGSGAPRGGVTLDEGTRSTTELDPTELEDETSSRTNHHDWPDPEFAPITSNRRNGPSPPSPPEPPSPPSRSEAQQRSDREYEDWAYVCTGLSWDPRLNTGIGRKRVRELQRSGVALDELVACGLDMLTQPFWQGVGIDINKVASQVQAFRSRAHVPRKPSLQERFERDVRELKEVFGDD